MHKIFYLPYLRQKQKYSTNEKQFLYFFSIKNQKKKKNQNYHLNNNKKYIYTEKATYCMGFVCVFFACRFRFMQFDIECDL